MQPCFIIQLFVLLLIIVENSNEISSPIKPFTTYKHSAELQKNIADLWWTVDDAELEIIIELHVKTTGWIALGISPGRAFRIDYDNHHFSNMCSWWNERS
jgi:hypothetical protein